MEKHWTDDLDPRELAQVQHATAYVAAHSKAGVPGHGQFMLIGKMAEMLDRYYQYIPDKPRVIKVMWNEECKCYRDMFTGVKVEIDD